MTVVSLTAFRCTACSNTSKPASSLAGAVAAAEADGWEIVDGRRGNCRDHHESVPGGWMWWGRTHPANAYLAEQATIGCPTRDDLPPAEKSGRFALIPVGDGSEIDVYWDAPW